MRPIDADALMEYCSNQKSKTISNNDIARFPTISADRPHGEWIFVEEFMGINRYKCSVCEREELLTYLKNFCPNCGAKMFREDGEA